MAIVSSIIFRDENCELHEEARSKQEATGEEARAGVCPRPVDVVLRWRLDCILDIDSVCPLIIQSYKVTKFNMTNNAHQMQSLCLLKPQTLKDKGRD